MRTLILVLAGLIPVLACTPASSRAPASTAAAVSATPSATPTATFTTILPITPAPTSAPPVSPPATPVPATQVPATQVPATPDPATPPPPPPPPASLPAPDQTCSPVVGGDSTVSRALVSVRVAHQSGFDRVVFDFGTGPVPTYRLEMASHFYEPSSKEVFVGGNVFLSLTFPRAGSMGSYTGPSDYPVSLPIVTDVKLTENFEGVLRWGIGLTQLTCPRVSQLSTPARLVLDFPTN